MTLLLAPTSRWRPPIGPAGEPGRAAGSTSRQDSRDSSAILTRSGVISGLP
ncbi:hypothetical protein BJ973_002681 [Actinoplanes tereljensis]|uniref:hypothetical protein n=1 Tax=Paractinoplanes tereljensis TaxID=571912 RepID=UPI0019405441|nr:hypothetical protein [Actinoplanes tereljensis]